MKGVEIEPRILGRVLQRLPEVLFYIACFLWLTVTVTDVSMVNKWMAEGPLTDAFVIHRVPLLLGAAEIIRIWRGEYGRRDALGLAFCMFMGYGAWLLGWHDCLCGISLVFCARNLNIRKLCAVSVAYVSFLAAVIIVLSQMGIVRDFVLEQSRGDRHCLGFTYCLYPGQYLFTLTLVVCWLRGKALRIWEAVALAIANVWMYVLTISRLSFGLALLAILFTLLYKWDVHQKLPWQRISRVLRWAFPAMVVITIVTTAAYMLGGTTFFPDFINRIDDGRVRLQANGIRVFGLPLLSQNVTFVGASVGVDGPSEGPIHGYNFVDNLFVHAGIRYGLLFTGGFTVLYTFASLDAHRQKDTLLVAMLALLACHCLFDNLALWIHHNVMVFVLATVGGDNSVIWSLGSLIAKLLRGKKYVA